MIKYNTNTINYWNLGDDNIVKVYRNGAVCYYKVYQGETSGQTPCYAVVDDISQYLDREFPDVYDSTAGKWYKLNNLNQYEEYGIMGEGRNITTYDGKLTVDTVVSSTYEFQYSGDTWVNVGEVTASTRTLPDVPFTVNYNARNYIATSHTIPYTTGQLNQIDAVITGDTSAIIDHSADGYIELTGQTSTAIRAQIGTENFSGNASNPNMTIVCKAFTPGNSSEGNIISNRGTTHNWMYRHKSQFLTLHGDAEEGQILVSNTTPNTCSVRVDSNSTLYYNNWTQSTTSSYSNFQYGSASNTGALFSGYYDTGREFWKGVFYWVYMSKSTLTDDQVRQVIDYNDNVSVIAYPVNYDTIQTPPDNVVFTSMDEAEEYECPWVGMHATIDGDRYVFSGDSISGYEWVYNPSRLPVGYTEVEYIENTGTSYFNTNFTPNQDTRVVMQYQMVTDSGSGRFWGAGAWNSATGLEPNYEGGHLQISWLGKTSWTSFNNVAADYNKHILDLNKNYLYLDETLVGSNTYTTKTASDPIGVFTYIGGGRPSSSTYWGSEHFKGKMFSFQIYDNGTLVRDLVPCIKDSDNTVGAYDIVNDVFYTVPTGYTTDKLVAGNPV